MFCRLVACEDLFIRYEYFDACRWRGCYVSCFALYLKLVWFDLLDVCRFYIMYFGFGRWITCWFVVVLRSDLMVMACLLW